MGKLPLRNVSISFALLGLLISACGGDESGSKAATGGNAGTGGAAGSGGAGGTATGGAAGAAGADAGPNAAQVAACAANAKSICARHKECFPVLGNSLEGKCEATYQQLCLDVTFLPDGSNDTVELLDACTASHGSVTCEQWVQVAFSNVNYSPKCVPPPGDRPDGAACSVWAQCQSGYCSGSKAGSCGICQKRVAVGGDCGTANDCEPGNYCSGSTCAPYRKEGESCDFVNRCIGGTLVCGAGGTCEKLKQNVGDACVVNDCAIYEKGLFCDAQDLKCAPLVFSALGGECGNTAAGGYAFCKDGNVCQVDVAQPADWKGTCIAAKKLGEACDPAFISGPNGGPCELFQACVGGVCKGLLDPACK